MSDRGKSYTYEGPLTFREGIQMEAGDELYLCEPEDWARGQHLCQELAWALGIDRDGATAKVRINVEML